MKKNTQKSKAASSKKASHVLLSTLFFLVLFALVLTSVNSQADQERQFEGTASAQIEATCRVQAKAVAAEAYRSCLVDKKSSQLEQLKQAYDKKLRDLKKKYEDELSSLAPARKKSSAEKTSAKANQLQDGSTQIKIQIPDQDQEQMNIPDPVPLKE